MSQGCCSAHCSCTSLRTGQGKPRTLYKLGSAGPWQCRARLRGAGDQLCHSIPGTEADHPRADVGPVGEGVPRGGQRESGLAVSQGPSSNVLPPATSPIKDKKMLQIKSLQEIMHTTKPSHAES